MNKPIKEAKLSKMDKEANIILDILSEFYEEGSFIYDNKIETINTPLGMFIWIDSNKTNKWMYSIDFTMCTEKIEIFMTMAIIQKISINKIDLIIDYGSQTCFNKKGEYIGFILQEDVYDIEREQNVTEKEAEKIAKKIKMII